MTFSIFRILTVFVVVLFALPLISRAQTDFSLGNAAADNIAVLYEGNGGKTLSLNQGEITGNVGIAGTGVVQANGVLTITGTVEFAAANTGQFSSNGVVTITGGETYSNSNVSSDISTLNTLSQSFVAGVPTDPSLTISSGGSLNLSSSPNGQYVYTLSSTSNFPNGTFTITGNGSGNQYVVVNVPMAFSFNGSIVLAGGLTSDQVLFNFTGGNYSTLSGGDTLTISTNGLTTMGTFLDPNGDFQVNHSVVDGRVIGGDSVNSSIVSGGEVNAPTVTPEPTSMLLFGTGLLALGGVLRRRTTGISA
jgi:hypothetical protein